MYLKIFNLRLSFTAKRNGNPHPKQKKIEKCKTLTADKKKRDNLINVSLSDEDAIQYRIEKKH